MTVSVNSNFQHCILCNAQYSGIATGGEGGQGGSVSPLTAKNLPKITKKRKKNQVKEEKIRKKRKNREGSFTLVPPPPATDRAGYATGTVPLYESHVGIPNVVIIFRPQKEIRNNQMTVRKFIEFLIDVKNIGQGFIISYLKIRIKECKLWTITL